VIAATNRSLSEMIEQGQFREDLFYRLNVIHMHVPPLREHREDIPLLIDYFLGQLCRQNGYEPRTLAPDACEALASYDWPGNVRQLENVIERLVVTSRNEVIRCDDLPLEVRTSRLRIVGPRRERRRSVSDDLYKRLVDEHESFWTAVYPLYMQREITRTQVRDVVRRGLEEARGNYKIVTRLFNMQPADYKKFLNFLRKHDCQLPFKEYR
jgi:DNA-binding NtrC family response regulator